ncbi:cysteine desulfurase family protein [Salinisphaera sp.]|uniref:cysteine desulfurase family protein n=1 Tax=Salinisphaera sp. TaxID=1914330 RepID=UPI000C515632|nr:cysteine desulfurase family protein [Salinisphaera sp.]MBS64137.1 cysteine desulfurase [Salinisphaera sp.]
MTIYFDHNATTPLHPDVFEAMRPWLTERHGNASSLHRAGREARAAIDTARGQVADCVNAHPSQVIFTAGGTEADNMALKGVAAMRAPGRMLISPIEHPAITDAAGALERDGWRIDRVAVDSQGRVDLADLQRQLEVGDVALVSIMVANNETGVLQDLPAIARAVRAAGAWLHTDAVQAMGKLDFDFAASGAHCASLSSHKIQGPKGVGALIVDKHMDMAPLVHGGGHEQGLRSGSYNVAGIVGFGAAAARLLNQRDAEIRHMRDLREQLEIGLDAMPGITRFSAEAERLPNTSQFAVAGYDGEGLLMLLDREDIAVSSGSACAAGTGEPSPVLLAMGIAPDVAQGAIRVSLGPQNTLEEIQQFLLALGRLSDGGGAMPGRISASVLG